MDYFILKSVQQLGSLIIYGMYFLNIFFSIYIGSSKFLLLSIKKILMTCVIYYRWVLTNNEEHVYIKI